MFSSVFYEENYFKIISWHFLLVEMVSSCSIAYTVQPCPTDICLIRTLACNGQFSLSRQLKRSYIFSLISPLNVDTWIMRTLLHVPLVSVLLGFLCMKHFFSVLCGKRVLIMRRMWMLVNYADPRHRILSDALLNYVYQQFVVFICSTFCHTANTKCECNRRRKFDSVV